MRPDVLRALSEVGTHPSAAGMVRCYHASQADVVDKITQTGELRPAVPRDSAERVLAERAGQRSAYVASSPTISDGLAHGLVVLALDVPEDVDAEVVRRWGTPPRVALELKLTTPLKLTWADRLDRKVSLDGLSTSVRDAVEMYRDSPVGRQLRQRGESYGRCSRASRRFLAALVERDPDIGRAARVLEWGFEAAFHHAVLLGEHDAVLDFTSNQFEGHEDDPFPLVRTRAQAELEWGWATSFDMHDPLDRFIHGVEPLMSWEVLREPVPAQGSERARLFRH